MISRVIALPKLTMAESKNKLLNDDRAIMISVIDPGEDRIFDEGTDKALTLFFHDIEISTILKLSRRDEYKAFSHADAVKITQFLVKHQAEEEEKILFVNCSAGICRSGAIVTFAHLVCETDDIFFVNDNPRILPNQWVLSKLCEVWLHW